MENKSYACALIEVDQDSGFIRAIRICAASDREAAVVKDALARIAAPRHWQWLQRLLVDNGYRSQERLVS